MNIKDILTADYSKEDGLGFAIIADIILNHCVINSNDSAYRICEIEFYLRSDKYTHCNPNKTFYILFS